MFLSGSDVRSRFILDRTSDPVKSGSDVRIGFGRFSGSDTTYIYIYIYVVADSEIQPTQSRLADSEEIQNRLADPEPNILNSKSASRSRILLVFNILYLFSPPIDYFLDFYNNKAFN